jgi:menaquinone-dependent protoporphyrinogen oxidase
MWRRTMKVLVAYATRYGSTEEIARFIAERLCAEGLQATAESVDSASDPQMYDGFVVGSAVYMGHWLKSALNFVNENADVLARKPTWLFSSGPLGPESTKAHDDTGAGSAEPEELPALRETVRPQDHAVFDGVLAPKRLSLGHKAIRLMPAGRSLLPEGDFRQWPAIEAWAAAIAGQLKAEKLEVHA